MSATTERSRTDSRGPALRNRRIAVIGGGSAYMPGVFRGLVHRVSELDDTAIVLYDIDRERSALMSRLGNRMVQAAGGGARVDTVSSLEEAIADSDFIFTTFRPGGFQARHLDERLPLEHGLVGQETCGPGGFFMACRSVPILLKIATTRDALAPNAWIVNYTNPTSIVAAAVCRYGSGRILALCDQNVADSALWSSLLGIDLTSADIDWVGTNHTTVARRVQLAGEDVTPIVRQKLAELEPEVWPDARSRQLAWLGRHLGLLVNSYLRYYYFHDAVVRDLRHRQMTRSEEILAALPRLYENYRLEAEQPRPDPSQERGGGDHGEFAVNVMCAVAGDESARFIMNTANGEAIDDMPSDTIVEVPCLVDRHGAHPISMGALPRPAKSVIQSVVAYEDLAVDAAARGDRALGLQALLAHPFVRDASEAEKLLREGLNAHSDFLPQFGHEA